MPKVVPSSLIVPVPAYVSVTSIEPLTYNLISVEFWVYAMWIHVLSVSGSKAVVGALDVVPSSE